MRNRELIFVSYLRCCTVTVSSQVPILSNNYLSVLPKISKLFKLGELILKYLWSVCVRERERRWRASVSSLVLEKEGTIWWDSGLIWSFSYSQRWAAAPVPEHFVDLFPSPQLLFVLLEETAHGQCLPPGGKREGTSWGLSLKVHT